jgi:hypothetical protein
MKKLMHTAMLLTTASLPGVAGSPVTDLTASQNADYMDALDREPPKAFREPARIIEDYVPVPEAEDDLKNGFDHDCVNLPDPKPLPEFQDGYQGVAGRFAPLISEGEYGYLPSQFFLEQAPVLTKMVHLSYARGKDFRYGHELTLGDTLKGWKIYNLKAVRGFVEEDPCCGFVAYNKELNLFDIALRGSVSKADWNNNYCGLAQPFSLFRDRFGRLPIPGQAHFGILHKYSTIKADPRNGVPDTDLMGLLDWLMAREVDPARLSDLKFIVTGQSQGAALGQILAVHLCLHLRRHFGPQFDNARQNVVQAWLLACPQVLDDEAFRFANRVVGRGNILVQNVGLDPVPNAGYTPSGRLKSAGMRARQESSEAMRKAVVSHFQATLDHLTKGELMAGIRGFLPQNACKAAIQALHMATDNVNYRGVGHSFAFDDAMVETDCRKIMECLRNDFEHRSNKAVVKHQVKEWLSPMLTTEYWIGGTAQEDPASPAPAQEREVKEGEATISFWGRVKGLFN